jgi:hypothetical protein
MDDSFLLTAVQFRSYFEQWQQIFKSSHSGAHRPHDGWFYAPGRPGKLNSFPETINPPQFYQIHNISSSIDLPF